MTGGVRVFGTERRGYFKNPVQTRRHQYLLIELRTLCQIGFLAEIIHREQGCSAFGPGRIYLGGGYLRESVLSAGFRDKFEHQGFQFEHRLHVGFSQIDESVVKTGIHLHVDFVYDSHGKRNTGFRYDFGGCRYQFQTQCRLVAFFHFAGNRNCRFSGNGGKFVKKSGFDFLFGHRYLNGAVSVP